MSFLVDFKKFAFKGNVVDLAIGVIIGGAFGKIVTAMVADIIMPLVSLVMPSGEWRDNVVVLRQAADAKNNVVLRYGDFLGSVLDLIIIALVLFLIVSKVVKAAEARLSYPETPPTPETQTCKYCLEVVPAKATRCKACTSQLATVDQAPSL